MAAALRRLIVLAFLALPALSFGGYHPPGGGRVLYHAHTTTNLATSGDSFMAFSGVDSSSPGSAAGKGYFQFPASNGSLKNMVCGLSGSFTAQTSTKSYTILLSGFADTTLTCVINSSSTCTTLANNYFGTGVCCEDTTHIYTIPTGTNWFIYKATAANTPNADPLECTVEWDPN